MTKTERSDKTVDEVNGQVPTGHDPVAQVLEPLVLAKQVQQVDQPAPWHAENKIFMKYNRSLWKRSFFRIL